MKEKLPPNPADIHGPNAGEPGYDAIKKGINESGEDLYIGTKEEIDRAKAKVESEGRAPDVASYIRLHKQIATPREALKEMYGQSNMLVFFENLPVGSAQLSGGNQDKQRQLYYKDAEGNLAMVDIDTYLIDSLGKESNSFALEDELRKLSFTVGTRSLFLSYDPTRISQAYTDRLAEQEKQASRDKFSF